MRKYKEHGNISLFDSEITLQKLSNLGNPLEKLSSVIDFEMFRERLESKLLNDNKKNNAGAKPYDVVMMFKIIILQKYYNISDEQAEYQINDRTSFKDFLGISSGDKVPDSRTIWLFRERLTETGLGEILFHDFVNMLTKKGLIFNEGQMIDASFVLAPKQRNTREENEKIKKGEGDDLWNDKPQKKSHKDIDARWTQKGGQNYFGYKANTKVDKKSKFVKGCITTPASVHDSQVLNNLLDESDRGQKLYADSAYVGQENTLQEYDLEGQICEKGYRNKPLSDEAKKSNKQKSRIRARVEHVFGFIEGAMHGFNVRTVGIKRATEAIFMTCFTYNLFRFEQITRLGIN